MEVRGSGQHPFQRRQFFRHKPGNVTHAFSFHQHQQVKAAARQIAGGDFVKTGDAHRQAVKAAIAFGRHFYFNEGRYPAVVFVFLIYHRLVAQNHAFLFPLLPLGSNGFFSHVKTFGQFAIAQAGLSRQ